MFVFMSPPACGGRSGGAAAPAGASGNPVGQRGGGAGSGSKSQGRAEVPGETGCPAGEQQQGCGQVTRTKQQETAGEPTTCSAMAKARFLVRGGVKAILRASSRAACAPFEGHASRAGAADQGAETG